MQGLYDKARHHHPEKGGRCVCCRVDVEPQGRALARTMLALLPLAVSNIGFSFGRKYILASSISGEAVGSASCIWT